MKFLFITISIGAMLLLNACEESLQTDAKPARIVSISGNTRILHKTTVPRYYSTSGTVTSDHRVSVSSRLSGYIRVLSVRAGQKVQRGDLLFRIDPVDARQAYEQRLADLKDVEADLNRYQGLLKKHAVSQQQFDKIQLKHTVTRSRMLQAKNQLQYASVRSPVSGYVVEKRASVGDLASPGQTIVVVEDPARLLIETYVSEQAMTYLHEGTSLAAYAAALDRHIQGKIRQIVSAADKLTHQFLVKIVLAQQTGILPGMFVEVHFSIGQRKALLIPAAAVIQRAGLTGIYIIDHNAILHYRLLRLGQARQGNIEVLAGLKADQVIAWRDDDQLASGMRLAGSPMTGNTR